MMSQSILIRWLLPVAVLALLPSFAFAHGDTGQTSITGTGSWLLGLAHPASGLDHLCAMLAVGLWAAQTGSRSIWVVPSAFVGVMTLGSVLPVLGIGLPFIEQGIALSVLLLGILIATSVRLSLWPGSAVVGLFALWHGHAHGTEMPATTSIIEYMLGFMLTTALLHAIGITFGGWMQRQMRERIIRAAGASIALCGVYLSAV